MDILHCIYMCAAHTSFMITMAHPVLYYKVYCVLWKVLVYMQVYCNSTYLYVELELVLLPKVGQVFVVMTWWMNSLVLCHRTITILVTLCVYKQR